MLFLLNQFHQQPRSTTDNSPRITLYLVSDNAILNIENMPTKEAIESFIQAVEQHPHDEVIEKFYTKDATIQENQNAPRVGIENLVKNERKMLQKAIEVHSECIRPFFYIGDKVVIRWKFRFQWKDGSITEIEEIAYQQWRGEQIYQEQFFYDPKQFVPMVFSKK